MHISNKRLRKTVATLALPLALALGLLYPVLWLGSANTAHRSTSQVSIATPKKYLAAMEMLEKFIEHEMQDKDLPALSIALVDDQQLVWARGFGFADPKRKLPATAETIYRVGSVSKLFTDIAVMQLVEQGKLDLDLPVTRYLPNFRPRNPFGKQITLRQLMSHRSGLVREPPVGNYFEKTEPSLARTVASLNRTELVYAPEARTKYSNAAIAAVGYVLERTQGEPVAKAAEALVRAHQKLKETGYGLLIHDAYRPWYVTKVFRDATPEDKKLFVADPAKGSRHNRGAAVDLTLYDLTTGKPVEMVGRTMKPLIAHILTIPAALLSNVGTATFCARRWRLKASPSMKPSGGISTTRTGKSTRFST